MSTAVLAAAALVVLYSTADLTLENCILASETSTSENTEQMDAMAHDPSSTFVRMQRRVSSINFASCFSGKGGASRQLIGGFRPRRQESKTEAAPEKVKPKYVHVPQHAADSHARTTSTIPFAMRPLSPDVTIQPVGAPVPRPYSMRSLSSDITIEPARTSAHFMEEERARSAAAQGGRVHIVGSTSR